MLRKQQRSNMNLSRNLSAVEFTKSNTATRLGIDNSIPFELLNNAEKLARTIFQPTRDYFGVPVYVSSGYRSEALNEAIGGSKTSAHNFGCALDIDMDFRGTYVKNIDIFNYALDFLDFDQLIFEGGNASNPAWVHIGIHKSGDICRNRNQVLIYRDKKYYPYSLEKLEELG